MNNLALHVHQFVPDAEGEELEHRITLLKARDFAAGLLARTISSRAYDHACDVHEMAGHFVFANVPTGLLDAVVKYCRHMVMAAMFAERLDDEGGAH